MYLVVLIFLNYMFAIELDILTDFNMWAYSGKKRMYEAWITAVDLVVLVRSKLEADGVPVKEIRLNGSGTLTV
jgi:hypothetical protein